MDYKERNEYYKSELARLSNEVVSSLDERDALTAQVDYFKNGMAELQDYIDKMEPEYEALKVQVNQLRIALVATRQPYMDYIPKLDKTAQQVLDATPAQCLAEIKAQAGRDGYEAGWDDAIRCIDKDPVIYSNSEEYANQLRAAAKD